MKTSIFICAYPGDADWLPYCLKSIAKYANGFHETVIAVQEADLPVFERFHFTREKLISYPLNGSNPYTKHMEMKMRADELCEGELICYLDCDCVFTAPTTPDLYLINGKPILLFDLFAELNQLKPQSPFQESTERALNRHVAVEMMRRHPAVYWASDLKRFRSDFMERHHMKLDEYMKPMHRQSPLGQNFSEFCVVGAYLYYNYYDVYHFVHALPALAAGTCPPSNVHQFWSFHRANHPEVQAKLKTWGLL